MLARVEPAHNNFKALARYLVHGKARPTSPDRVAWSIGHNIPTDDPELAAILMAATAEKSRRCKNAAYHMTINWHPDEKPAPEIMQEIALKTLELAGLAEHQALVMGHGDKPHAHLHMMVNRVHPGTGKAWSTSHDYKRFDRIMKLLADEHGFLYVPGHAFEPEATDELPKQPGRKARQNRSPARSVRRASHPVPRPGQADDGMVSCSPGSRQSRRRHSLWLWARCRHSNSGSRPLTCCVTVPALRAACRPERGHSANSRCRATRQ